MKSTTYASTSISTLNPKTTPTELQVVQELINSLRDLTSTNSSIPALTFPNIWNHIQDQEQAAHLSMHFNVMNCDPLPADQLTPPAAKKDSLAKYTQMFCLVLYSRKGLRSLLPHFLHQFMWIVSSKPKLVTLDHHLISKKWVSLSETFLASLFLSYVDQQEDILPVAIWTPAWRCTEHEFVQALTIKLF